LPTKALTRTRSRDKTKQANDDVASPVDIAAEFERFAAAMTSLATRQADGRGRSAPSVGKRRGPQPSISAETIDGTPGARKSQVAEDLQFAEAELRS
jgi:hypothetical protein